MKSVPLRVALVVIVVALSAGGLVVSGVAAAESLHGYLQDRVDNQLQQSLNSPGQLEDALRNGFHRPDSFGTIYVQVTGVGSSPLPNGVSAPKIPTKAHLDHAFTVRSTNGDGRWRVIEAINGEGGVLVVAVPLDDVHRTVARLIRIELLVGLAVLVLLGLGAFAAVRRSLKPLVAVEAAAGAVAAGDLTQRVPEGDPRTEVGSLSRSFNSMVAQIETAFAARQASEAEAVASEERMRRFVGDASHELRTPLTSIRGFAELYRQGALPTPADVNRAMSRVESEASRMGVLVEDLLLLARLDQQRPLQYQPVDLISLARDAVQDAQAIDPSRSLSLDVVGAPPVIDGDPGRLRQVLDNLLSNALTHTDGPVAVRVFSTDGTAYIEVADSGPGIPEQDRAKVFERFYRGDSSRTRTSGGTGLGLSIVSALVAAHHGSVTLEDTPGGGATFRVSLPAA